MTDDMMTEWERRRPPNNRGDEYRPESATNALERPAADRISIVCLDCGRLDSAGDGALVYTHLTPQEAAAWVVQHLAARDHRTVTVPGWPRRRDAIALAKVHVEATRIGRPGDDQCSSDVTGRGDRCALKAGHLGRCEP